MRKLLVLLGLLAVATPAAAQIAIPYSFSSGQTILSSQVNANFSALANAALNKAGDTITGNITVSANVTIDGVDISDFLDSSGIVFANADGTVTAPAFSRVTDPNTGIYFPAADSLAMTLGGTQRWLLNASGLTVFGVNLVNSSGKIPALTSTYFTSVAFDAANLTGTAAAINGSAITALNATALATGTVADGRLSANVPLINAANDFTSATANTFDAGIKVGNNKSIVSVSGLLIASAANGLFLRTAAAAGGVSIADDNAAPVTIAGGGGIVTVAGATNFSSSVNLTGAYLIFSAAPTAVTLAASVSNTVNPGNAQFLDVTANTGAGTDAIQTINGGTNGRILGICNAGANGFVLNGSGGNVNTNSGSIGPGTCVNVVFRSSNSKWWFD